MPRLLHAAALIVATASVVLAVAENAPTTYSSTKILTGKACKKTGDSACSQCSLTITTNGGNKQKNWECLECSSSPVAAEFNEDGDCACPAGSGKTGTRYTVKSGRKIPKHGVASCSECAVNAFAEDSAPVGSARCIPCPTGSTTEGQTGATECVVLAGYYYVDGEVAICTADHWCPGGAIGAEGNEINECSPGRSSPEGSDGPEDCVCGPNRTGPSGGLLAC